MHICCILLFLLAEIIIIIMFCRITLQSILLGFKIFIESLRGSDSYGFCFSNEWLKDYGSLFLSDDLNNYLGLQYMAPDKDIFGCFSDALPDRWGRTLTNLREQIMAKEEKRPVCRLSSFDYLEK